MVRRGLRGGGEGSGGDRGVGCGSYEGLVVFRGRTGSGRGRREQLWGVEVGGVTCHG